MRKEKRRNIMKAKVIKINAVKHPPFGRERKGFKGLIALFIFAFSVSFVYFYADVVRIDIEKIQNEVLQRPPVKRSGPVYARGIYLNSRTASNPKKVEEAIHFILRNRLNSAVIDIKDSYGRVIWQNNNFFLKGPNSSQDKIRDLTSLVRKFRKNGIYTIARISVFQDNELAENRPELALLDKKSGQIWRDNRGLSWVDPASLEVWTYNINLAKQAFSAGFEEVNFDYVRFPSDGSIWDIKYPIWDGKKSKPEIIKDFFAFQNKELKGFGPTSVDIFGMTLWHIEDGLDMNIGQRLIDALPYFAYVCPMVYPSHFPSGFLGFSNPADHPYEVIYNGLSRAKPFFEGRESKLRPWLQSFNLRADYTPEMIRQEIQAVEDGSGYGWILWNAQNNYINGDSPPKSTPENPLK